MMNANTLHPNQSVKVKVDGEMVVATYVRPYVNNPDYGVFQHNGREVIRAFSRCSAVEGQAAVQVVDSAVTNVPAEPEVYFDVNTRFDFINNMVDMLVRGFEKSLIITGSGGLGKSYTVFNRLKQNDLGDADYEKISGHMTPKALFRRLHESSGKLVVFDDCDSILCHETSINLLKASLDSYGTRTLCWCTELGSREDELPTTFEFTGRVIFISNYALKDFPQPIVSRALYVDVTMTPDEKIQRIKAIAPALVPDLNESERTECIDLLDLLRHKISDLNLRTLLKVASIRRACPADWRNMATYMATAQLNGNRR